MKIKLRKSVVFFLLVTVFAAVVLYTDSLGVYFTYGDEAVGDVRTLAFAGEETRALNLLPQEQLTKFKEPIGEVYSENSKDTDAPPRENARITRQLTEEFPDDGTTNSSDFDSDGGIGQSSDENTIRQVTDTVYNVLAEKEGDHSDKSNLGMETMSLKNDIKEEREPRRPRRSSRKRGKDIPREPNEGIILTDIRIRTMKDQLVQAKVYLSLSATRNNPQFVRDLRLRMKEVQRALGAATRDSELARNANERLRAMEKTLMKGKQIQDDCSAVVKKLRAMLQLSDEQLRIHRKQALFLTHLAAKTVPKGLHCLPLRLTTEYFMLDSSQQHFSNKEKLVDASLFHYALFSDNTLAAAVVVNSTITHAKDASKHVFHIVTDRLNYAAMKMWFLANPPGKATIQVQNVEEFTWLNSSYSPVLKQLGMRSMIDYYFKSKRAEPDSNLKFRNPKYLSIMNHLRFYLPEIFPKLNKVLFLDDDIVVQKDLSNLWSLNLKGKVIGVVETCGESFHRFDRYLNFSNPIIAKIFSPRACGWAFGMNIFDLNEWRKQNITDVYHKWQNLNQDRLLWKLGTLPPGLITFWNQTYALDKSWHVLGLGYDPNVSQKDIEQAAVIHYNGNLKPWLEIALPKFRNYWSKYVDYDHPYLRECNLTP